MSNLAILEFNSVNIKVNEESMMSLTDLWKASGKDEVYKPTVDARSQAKILSM
ncbi:MAG: hypothetical protein H6Q69_3162 [Firmicutes bacterium]|nr:hypothetical protein [Bacillota bacterium]